MIFNTERLIVRELKEEDSEFFFDMMRNPNVMNPIPQDIMTRHESDQKLQELIFSENMTSVRKVWGVVDKEKSEFIGIAALLINDENEDKIGYRLREQHWKKGFGTEIAKGLITYSFEELNFEKLTADVNISNLKSVNILDKLMEPVREFYNEKDQCTDRRYKLEKQNWLKNDIQ